ncbi:DUF1194 domain-containing protein [Psychromarinibacter sp. S121]|uniref:DUF1194 domain-containing protein n=1 Tax=Psychromarinibacter sp. S121 TaxID=3415127 RepID=UPI003C7DA638
MVRRFALALTCGAALAAAPDARADCRLALVLALDISSSVDNAEDRLQREGLAAALTSPEIVEAILALPEQPVALAVYEWSGRYQQDLLVDWTMLDTRDDVVEVAGRIARSIRSYADYPTAIGYSLGYAAGLFESGPDCLYSTLDVSGDGRNNEGFGPDLAYENFPLAEVTVNGLTIGGEKDGLSDYYRENVIKGPGAFVEEALDFDDFERAMRKKLLRELEVRAVGSLPRDAATGDG